jgi:glycosyltransferase involved in cell wall biosynthesis
MTQSLRYKTFDDTTPVVVSICTIAYNQHAFIEECLEGFLDQECDFRVEIVIHDDASSDGTSDIINNYAARYPTIIRTIMQDENQYSKGVNPYYAYVFPAARGTYIAICDGDDFWSDPVKLTRQVAVLEAEPEAAITYGSVRAVNEKGEDVSHKGGACRNLSPEELKAGTPLNTLTVCFRNIFRDAPLPVFLRNSPIGDLTVWGMLGYHGGGRFIADMPPAKYRIHDGGILSLLVPRKQHFMTAIAQMTLAAYHTEKGDILAGQQSLKIALKNINNTKMVYFEETDIDGMSLRNRLRIWNRRRKLRRSKNKGSVS